MVKNRLNRLSLMAGLSLLGLLSEINAGQSVLQLTQIKFVDTMQVINNYPVAASVSVAYQLKDGGYLVFPMNKLWAGGQGTVQKLDENHNTAYLSRPEEVKKIKDKKGVEHAVTTRVLLVAVGQYAEKELATKVEADGIIRPSSPDIFIAANIGTSFGFLTGPKFTITKASNNDTAVVKSSK